MNEEPETRHELLAGDAHDTEARQPGRPDFAAHARRDREALQGRVHSDSTELIREDRARDYDNAWS